MQKHRYLSIVVIIALALSMTLLVTNSFGWFFNSVGGGDNSVSVGDFDFTVEDIGATATKFDLGVLTPTLVTDVITDDGKILEADKQFDEAAKIISVAITNTGKIDFIISVAFSGATQGLHCIIVEKSAQQVGAYEKVKNYFTYNGVTTFPTLHSGFINSLSGVRMNAETPAQKKEYELIVWLCYTCAGYPTKPPSAGVSQTIKMNVSAVQAEGV